MFEHWHSSSHTSQFIYEQIKVLSHIVMWMKLYALFARTMEDTESEYIYVPTGMMCLHIKVWRVIKNPFDDINGWSRWLYEWNFITETVPKIDY